MIDDVDEMLGVAFVIGAISFVALSLISGPPAGFKEYLEMKKEKRIFVHRPLEGSKKHQHSVRTKQPLYSTTHSTQDYNSINGCYVMKNIDGNNYVMVPVTPEIDYFEKTPARQDSQDVPNRPLEKLLNY